MKNNIKLKFKKLSQYIETQLTSIMKNMNIHRWQLEDKNN